MGSQSTEAHKVIIVGAGPVGLTTAINLARLGVDTLVLEQGDGIDQSPRATSYQPCVMAEMQETGILEDVKKKSMVNNVLSYWLGRGPEKERVAVVEKLEGGSKFPSGINCGQPILASTILDHLVTWYSGHAQVRFHQRLEEITQTDSTVSVRFRDPRTNEDTEYTAEWLVGADGAGSTVRRLLDIQFEGFSWPKEDFCATNIRYPFEKYGFTTANFIMDPVHWAVITVIDNTGLWRCAFGVKAGMTNNEIRAEIDEHFQHILPGWPNEEYELVQLNRYKPHQRCASMYKKGRCLLAGDAAHSNNPIGGLGLTTGLLDAGPLGRALGAVVNGKAPASILDDWAQLRRDKWLNFTNEFSIENKRMVQRGGYSDDPAGIWKMDEVSALHGMDKWIKSATLEKRQADSALWKNLANKETQLVSRLKQWDIAMDPRWMEAYEDPEVVKERLLFRPIKDTSTKTYLT
ncbi:FAD binding domain-containing protein [Pyrenochaeta sp. MPI-SDFR-AT-0127]|nr:FAD binding domain-containing protein [Pyrenochaeta sp. MPI-SDFR-AT-0127]